MSRPARHPEDHKIIDDIEDPLSNYDPPVFADNLEQQLAEQPVTAVRTQPVSMVTPDTQVQEAMRLMSETNVRCVLVVEDQKLLGVFTERDVLIKVADQFDTVRDHPVREFMTPEPVTACETDKVADALSAIARGGLRHVPVLDVDDNLVGVVSPQRVVAFLQEHFQ